jgi:hypothetical protein
MHLKLRTIVLVSACLGTISLLVLAHFGVPHGRAAFVGYLINIGVAFVLLPDDKKSKSGTA